ncbi:MAG: carbon-nitrogen hydrolase family protein [Candidatus Rokubacteria bacterium]|nr:carbon-nitrogen hydrolase family protein [Candidatus Rokubacteria bacterium]
MRVALVQMNSQDDKAANLERAEELIARAAAWGPDLVVLPELWTYLGPRKRHAEVAEPIPGETSEWLGRLAARYRFWLVGGSYLEAVEGTEGFYNTSVALSPDGELVARYRKLHLFDVDLDGKTFRESATMVPGDEVVVASLGRAPVGLTICYDLRFPELYRRLVVRGARLVTVPSAFTMETGKDHWEVLLRARAIENQVYLLAAAQCGTHPPNEACYGNTMVVDPWGTVIARAGYREGVVVADLDFGEQERIRLSVPALQHRREDLFIF